jgi:hypothetical protein
MRRALPLLLVLALLGCSKDRTKDVVGTWSGGQGGNLTFSEDGKVKMQVGQFTADGSWKLAGDKVTVTTETVQGQPIATVKKQAQAMAGRLPAEYRKQIDNMDQPKTSTLSSDGKTMTSDQNGPDGKPATLTKAG